MGEQELEKKVKPKELIQAEKLIEKGEFDKAKKLLIIFEKKKRIHNFDKLSCYYLRGQLLIWQGQYDKVINLSDEMYSLSRLHDYNLQSIDALILISYVYIYQNNDDKALKIMEEAEKLLNEISQESTNTLLQREAHFLYCHGLIYFHKGDVVRSLEYLERSATIRKKIGKKQEIAQSLWTIARILAYNGKLDRAFNILERSLTLAMESKSIFYIGLSHNSIGVIYLWKGELNQSIVHFEKSLAIFKKINNERIITGIQNNMAEMYYLKGESNRALEYLEQILAFNEDIGRLKTNILDTAIHISLESNNVKRAQDYFKDLEEINDQEDNEEINYMYLYNKALILKSSSLKSDQIRAREILKEIIGKKIPFLFETSVRALFNLCDMLLTELHDTSNLELLDQIQFYINQILDIAKNQKLYWLLVESYLLEVKLDLLILDMKKARETLTQAQKIAEKYSMNQLIKRLSIEEEKLLNQSKKWQKLKDSHKAIIDLSNITPLKEQLRYMLKKRFILKSLNA
jgi:tetratricopeptide (TPR) repeat protein